MLQALANGLAPRRVTCAWSSRATCRSFRGPYSSTRSICSTREVADLVIPRDDYGLQPMHAVYRREPVLEAVRQAIARGDKRMNSYFAAVRVRQMEVDEMRALDPSRGLLPTSIRLRSSKRRSASESRLSARRRSLGTWPSFVQPRAA